MAKKFKKKSKENTVMRWIIFLSLVGLTAASIYVLKHPDLLTMLPHKKKIPPSPIMKEKNISVNLYFGDSNSDYLIPEPRRMVFQEGAIENNAKKIIEELIKGPKSNLIQTIPHSVTIRGIALQGNTRVVIDFSPELARNHPGGSLAEMQTIYSIVNSTLLAIPSLKEVQILVDGKSKETLKGHIDLRAPLKANLSLIKKG
jgi:spore germination protein GerM